MSLPISWVDKIFQKMTLIYGRDFLMRWEGLAIADVKTDWCHELSGFENWPEAIAHALANMPPMKPPTVLEFRDLARKAPKPERVQLPAPAANPAAMADALRKLQPVINKPASFDHKAWAKRIMARHKAGDRLTPISVKFAQEALGIK